MKRHLLFIILFIPLLFLVQCESPNQNDVQTIPLKYAKQTYLPEKSRSLERVIQQGDTLIFEYSSGDAIPNLSPGQILMGTQAGGYLKKVIQTSVQGNRLVVMTQQAKLTEAIESCEVHRTEVLEPPDTVFYRMNQLLRALDTTLIQYDSLTGVFHRVHVITSYPFFRHGHDGEYDWVLVIPDITISSGVHNGNTNFSLSLNIDSLKYEFQPEFHFDLVIEWFNVTFFESSVGFKTRSTMYSSVFSLTGLVSQILQNILKITIFELPESIPLGTLVHPSPPITINFSLDFNITSELNKLKMDGLDLEHYLQLDLGYNIGVYYTPSTGWVPIFDPRAKLSFQPSFKPNNYDLLIDIYLIKLATQLNILLYNTGGIGFEVNLGEYFTFKARNRLLESGYFTGWKGKLVLKLLGILKTEHEFIGEEYRYPALFKWECISP